MEKTGNMNHNHCVKADPQDPLPFCYTTDPNVGLPVNEDVVEYQQLLKESFCSPRIHNYGPQSMVSFVWTI